MRKVLFLDIDGVLNPKWWVRKAFVDRYGCAYDSECVANLDKMIAETGAEIVISSSWKCMGLKKLQNMWEDRGLPGKIVGVTPDMLGNRGEEIKEWLMLHGKNVSHYVILDDMNDVLQEQEPHFVWIDPEVGITEGNAVQAIMILNCVHNKNVVEKGKTAPDQDRQLFYSEEFWKKTPEQILKESEEHQMRARAYEMEYHKRKNKQ